MQRGSGGSLHEVSSLCRSGVTSWRHGTGGRSVTQRAASKRVQASDESAARVVARRAGDHPAVTAVCIFVAALDLV